MKLEIELDLNKIDYDAINKQIQEKINDMDLNKMYQIDREISDTINERVKIIVKEYLCRNRWVSDGELNSNAVQLVREEVRCKIQETVNPFINDIFEKLPQDELNKIIVDLIPIILVNMLEEHVRLGISNYFDQSSAIISNIATDRIKNTIYYNN